MKSEILHDHDAPSARAPRASPCTDLTLTTHHLSLRPWARHPHRGL